VIKYDKIFNQAVNGKSELKSGTNMTDCQVDSQKAKSLQ